MKNNLKRIAIILPVIALLLAFLAVPAAADYSPETGWSEPVASFNEPFSFNQTLGTETLLVSVYGYHMIPDFLDLDTSVIPLGQQVLPDDFEFYYLIQNDDGSIRGILCKGLRVSDSGVTYTMSMFSEDNWFESQVQPVEGASFFFFAYPLEVLPEGAAYFEMFGFDVYSYRSSAVEPIGNVWTGITTWITSALTSVMGAFYVDGSLTLLGTLACIGVSVGIGFLLIGLIQRFLKLRG